MITGITSLTLHVMMKFTSLLEMTPTAYGSNSLWYVNVMSRPAGKSISSAVAYYSPIMTSIPASSSFFNSERRAARIGADIRTKYGANIGPITLTINWKMIFRKFLKQYGYGTMISFFNDARKQNDSSRSKKNGIVTNEHLQPLAKRLWLNIAVNRQRIR
ncbi:hypothetical protein DF196_09165 [Bifidobacterium callitrichidarum]|uniref:Uncharacterized protein n=1 Tax=Bifidobacterium callitrichidarum TaxID=2052941 RepID=A0A2U2N632_9BIFI|nr:hypothetical protein DF196_09165 [Bifidobacterium callitrichidarum]